MSNNWRHNADGLEGEKQREAQCREGPQFEPIHPTNNTLTDTLHKGGGVLGAFQPSPSLATGSVVSMLCQRLSNDLLLKYTGDVADAEMWQTLV